MYSYARVNSPYINVHTLSACIIIDRLHTCFSLTSEKVSVCKYDVYMYACCFLLPVSI